jgi:chromosome segregation ATPase
MKLEQKRDQEYSQLKIQHWEELYQNCSTDAQKLERQLEELQSNIHLQRKELEILRPKLAELEENKTNLLSQLKGQESKIDSQAKLSEEMEREIENLRKEKERMIRELSEREDRMHANDRESTHQIDRMRSSYEEKIAAIVENHEKKREVELELLRADLEAEYITQLSDQETEMNEKLIQAKEMNEKLTREVNLLKKERTHFEELYEEEKTESGALRLRLQMLSNQSNQKQPSFSYPPPPLPSSAEGTTDPYQIRIAPQSVSPLNVSDSLTRAD